MPQRIRLAGKTVLSRSEDFGTIRTFFKLVGHMTILDPNGNKLGELAENLNQSFFEIFTSYQIEMPPKST
jgi:hypothetical protein